jgi:CDP-diacylglycerol--glycerol-3-phosphate 3-phosphatidyltransferase/cardiolipin synthase
MTHERHTLTLATKVTLLRILGIPVFILLVIYYKMGLAAGTPNETHRLMALGVFLLVAVTDALDGYLARHRNEVTRLGKILDPVADKALMLSAVILLTRPTLPQLQPQFPVWFALLVISRDVVLILGAFLVHGLHGHVEIQPHMTGKIATCLLMFSIACALLKCPQPFFLVSVALAAVFIAASGLRYIVSGIVQLERGFHERES